jgi:hypothetical protein
MSNDDDVRTERADGQAGINERLALLDAGGSRMNDGCGRAQDLGREFKRDACARGGFVEEQRDAFFFE